MRMSQFKEGDVVSVLWICNNPDFQYAVVTHSYNNDTYHIMYPSDDSEDVPGSDIVLKSVYNSPLYQALL